MTRSTRIAAIATVLSMALACEQTAPAPRPSAVPAAKPPAGKPSAPKIDGLRAGPHKLGPLTNKVQPTVEAVQKAMGPKYQVRKAGEGATATAALEVLYKGDVVLEVFASDDGSYIERTVSAHPHVVFPWDTKVGARIGSHKNWNRMTCTLALAPFEGKALCNAFAEARISYFVEGWEGDEGTLPGKELMSDLKISGVVWKPDPPGAGE